MQPRYLKAIIVVRGLMYAHKALSMPSLVSSAVRIFGFLFYPLVLVLRLASAATLGPCPRPLRGVVTDLSNTSTCPI